MNKVHIIGGGTVTHITNHFAVSAPAYGSTARKLFQEFRTRRWERGGANMHSNFAVETHLTRMAGGPKELETNDDVEKLIDDLLLDEETKVIIMNAALCDWKPLGVHGYPLTMGATGTRLHTFNGDIEVKFTPAAKVVSKIRAKRNDILLVAFKTTCGASEAAMIKAGAELCNQTGADFIVANDSKTLLGMIVYPSGEAHCVTTDRAHLLHNLALHIEADCNDPRRRPFTK